jgi:hypothetical protein
VYPGKLGIGVVSCREAISITSKRIKNGCKSLLHQKKIKINMDEFKKRITWMNCITISRF